MKTFKEFLADQAVQIRSESLARAAVRGRWISAVAELIERMKAWIEEDDTEHLVQLEPLSVDCTDHSIGGYSIDGLRIVLGGRFVDVVPVAYEVMGPLRRPRKGSWRGRVDLTSEDDGNKLYRFVGEDQEEEWWIYDREDRQLQPFTRERFESAMVSLLS